MSKVVRCSACGEKAMKGKLNAEGQPLCRACFNVEVTLKYCRSMEKRRGREEQWNKSAFDQCRNLAAWISIYQFGAPEYRKRAAAIINSIVEIALLEPKPREKK